MRIISKAVFQKITPKIKKKIRELVICTVVGGTILTSCSTSDFPIKEHNLSQIEKEYAYLNFQVMDYQGKKYLTLEEEDLRKLITVSLKQSEKEYLAHGATPRFSVDSKEYSCINEDFILAIWEIETSLRILELKNEQDLFDPNNYIEFLGKDKKGNVYYGLGMVSSVAVEDIIKRDRTLLYNIEDAESLTVGAKKISMDFENFNPYLYLKNEGANNEKKIRCALAENIQFNAQMTYIILNRIVADSVKQGVHDKELKQLNSHKELEGLTQTEKQLWFSALCYNEGFGDVYNKLNNGALFETNNNGEYVLNIEYAFKVMGLYRNNIIMSSKGEDIQSIN